MEENDNTCDLQFSKWMTVKKPRVLSCVKIVGVVLFTGSKMSGSMAKPPLFHTFCPMMASINFSLSAAGTQFWKSVKSLSRAFLASRVSFFLRTGHKLQATSTGGRLLFLGGSRPPDPPARGPGSGPGARGLGPGRGGTAGVPSKEPTLSTWVP